MSARPHMRAGKGRGPGRVVLAGLVLTAAIGSGAGCTRNAAGAKPAARPPVPVSVATAGQKDVPVQVLTIGTVEARSTVTLKPQVAGQIQQIHFTEGQDVAQGDLLFTIDPRPFEAALRQAEANLAKDTALATDAEREASRNEELYRKQQAATREVEQSRANADALQAAVAADRALADQARLELEYCSIRAPIVGVTGRFMTERGMIVKANETPLVMINQVSPIYVAFQVPEQHLADITRYRALGDLKVDVTVAGREDIAESGILTFVNNEVDRATGTIGLRATFTNQQRRLWPGQFVNVVLTLTTQPQATVVPSQAVQVGQNGAFIFVVKSDRTVESRAVTTGLTVAGETVLEQGAAPGEVVVTDGHLRLIPGATVEIKGSADPEKKPQS
jgi:membrane fusion protein, multidrug efflux system